MIESSALDYTPDAFLQAAGVVIPFDPQVITPAICQAIIEGRFEAEEASQIPRIVRPGDRVLEIGAGIGFISTLLSRQRRVSRVIAVEANPHLIDYMTRLHALQQGSQGTPAERGPDQRAARPPPPSTSAATSG